MLSGLENIKSTFFDVSTFSSLHNEHPAHCGKITRLELIEIDARGDLLTNGVQPVPIGGASATSVEACCMMS